MSRDGRSKRSARHRRHRSSSRAGSCIALDQATRSHLPTYDTRRSTKSTYEVRDGTTTLRTIETMESKRSNTWDNTHYDGRHQEIRTNTGQPHRERTPVSFAPAHCKEHRHESAPSRPSEHVRLHGQVPRVICHRCRSTSGLRHGLGGVRFYDLRRKGGWPCVTGAAIKSLTKTFK